MDDKESYIVKKHDVAEIVRTRDKDALADLLEEPVTAIAEAITGWLASGPMAGAVAAGHIVQGALKGRLFQQFSQELQDFRNKGRIPDDFAEKRFGFQSWVELLTVIDEETPDEERLEALKAMFYSINKVNTTDGERIIGYQLFQIAKKLTSGELLLLKAVFDLYRQGKFGSGLCGFRDWAYTVSNAVGHSMIGLIEHHEVALIDNQLLTGRAHPDNSGVHLINGRLTDLGIRFCENIERYQLERKS